MAAPKDSHPLRAAPHLLEAGTQHLLGRGRRWSWSRLMGKVASCTRGGLEGEQLGPQGGGAPLAPTHGSSLVARSNNQPGRGGLGVGCGRLTTLLW